MAIGDDDYYVSSFHAEHPEYASRLARALKRADGRYFNEALSIVEAGGKIDFHGLAVALEPLLNAMAARISADVIAQTSVEIRWTKAHGWVTFTHTGAGELDQDLINHTLDEVLRHATVCANPKHIPELIDLLRSHADRLQRDLAETRGKKNPSPMKSEGR